MTIVNFLLLSFRGAALYDYYHYYADRASMYQLLQATGLTVPLWRHMPAPIKGLLQALGYVVHKDGHGLIGSNVADVFNSLMNIVNTAVTILILLASPALSRRFDKKAVAAAGFGLAGLFTAARYVLGPADVGGMMLLTILISACYAPTIPLTWAMYADVADYCEWTTGRRFAGMAFAGVGLALKIGLALGSSLFLWIMVLGFRYVAAQPRNPAALLGFRVSSSVIAGGLLLLCALLTGVYKLDRTTTRRMADELKVRREQMQAGAAL